MLAHAPAQVSKSRAALFGMHDMVVPYLLEQGPGAWLIHWIRQQSLKGESIGGKLAGQATKARSRQAYGPAGFRQQRQSIDYKGSQASRLSALIGFGSGFGLVGNA